ncbi:MAG TPA: DciA family protein [Usitatibacteraceae bacterium]|nr:DciA family protein [Usitatibacteraceae bacterium]
MNRHPPKSLGTLLRESDGLKTVRNRFDALSRLQQSLADALPPGLKESSRVAAVEGSTLVVAVANGAVAAKMKQMLPRLLTQIRENKTQEQQVTSISLLVQPDFRGLAAAPAATQRRPIPVDRLKELADSLADSPLKEAVQQIRRKRTRAPTDK